MADPSRKIGKYEIQEMIGRGGFATVYRARDTVLDRAVALKVLAPHLIWDPDFVARFKQEARVAAQLRHPNIVSIYEIDEVEGQLFIALELVTAGSLRDYMQVQGPLSVAAALKLLAPIADALDEAHSQGLVHRDVKPANILLDRTRTGKIRPLLTDFGLVKALSQNSELTRTGAVLGTVEYMAPEQIDIDRADEVSPATDIYALGIVVYHMLTGQVPFSGSSAQVMYAHINKAPPSPSAIRAELPAAVSSAILTALAKQPGERFATATDFVETLTAAIQPAPAAPATFAPPPGPQTPPSATPAGPDKVDSAPAAAPLAAPEPPARTQPAAPAPTPSPVVAAPMTAVAAAADAPPPTPDPAAAAPVDAAGAAPAAPASAASRLSALFRTPSKPLFAVGERPRFIGSLFAASVIGAALGWPISVWIGGPLTDWRWEAPLTGLMFGLIIAAFQTPRLSRLIPGRFYWALATGAGALMSAVLLRDVDLGQTLRYFLVPLVTLGLLQALVLWRRLHPIWAIGWAPVLAAAWLAGLMLAWRVLPTSDGEEIKHLFSTVTGESLIEGFANLVGSDAVIGLFAFLGWLIRGVVFGAVVGAALAIYLAFSRGRHS